MTGNKPSRGRAGAKPAKERRAGPQTRALVRSLRRLKAVLNRPLGLMRGEDGWRVIFVERRAGAAAEAPVAAEAASRPITAMARLCADLQERLQRHTADPYGFDVHHLLMVYEGLTSKGWAGVEALPAPVLGQALFQAQRLNKAQELPALTLLVGKLRQILAAVDERRQRDTGDSARVDGAQVQVSEASHEDFEESRRTWFDSLPQETPAPAPEK